MLFFKVHFRAKIVLDCIISHRIRQSKPETFLAKEEPKLKKHHKRVKTIALIWQQHGLHLLIQNWTIFLKKLTSGCQWNEMKLV